MGATFAFTTTSGLFPTSKNDSFCTGLCCLPSRVCCRRWVSSQWICLLLYTAEIDLLKDWHCCGDILEWSGSKERKIVKFNHTSNWKISSGHLSAGKTISRIPAFGWELIFWVGIISISEMDTFWQLEERIKQNKQFQLHSIVTDKIWNQLVAATKNIFLTCFSRVECQAQSQALQVETKHNKNHSTITPLDQLNIYNILKLPNKTLPGDSSLPGADATILSLLCFGLFCQTSRRTNLILN